MSIAEVHEVEVLEEHLPSGLWREAWRRLRRNPVAIIGASFVAIFVIVAIFAPLLAPYPPNEQNLGLLVNGCCPGPSWAHPMGVDELGREPERPGRARTRSRRTIRPNRSALEIGPGEGSNGSLMQPWHGVFTP